MKGGNDLSITYPDLENKFPDSIDTFDRFLDPTLSMLSVINQYYIKFDAGDLDGATALLVANPTLKQMVMSADNLNQLRDMCISLQRYYMNDVQQYLVNIINYKGIYSSSTKYSKYDVVNYVVGSATQSFMCISTITSIGVLPTNATYFIPLTLRGEQGVSGTGLSYRGGWTTIQYYANDCVVHNNALWSADIDNLNSEPTDINTNWTKIMEYHNPIIMSLTQPMGQSIGDYWYEIL